MATTPTPATHMAAKPRWRHRERSEPKDKRHEKHRPQREREPPDHGASGGALQVRAGVVDGLRSPPAASKAPLAIKRADLEP